MKYLTLSDSNPDFGFYGVEIFTGFEAGFEYSRIRTLSLIINIKLMNFFLSHALTPSNVASIFNNIFLMMLKKHIFIFETCLIMSSSNSLSIQL